MSSALSVLCVLSYLNTFFLKYGEETAGCGARLLSHRKPTVYFNALEIDTSFITLGTAVDNTIQLRIQIVASYRLNI